MLKNITIIHLAKDADKVIDLVENAINKARYKKQLQFVFFVEKDRKNAAVNAVIHGLYMKYPPDIFDIHSFPTIKAVVGESNDVHHWEKKCIEKADAPIMLKPGHVEELIQQYPQDWDMHYLDTKVDGIGQSPREFHQLQTEEAA